MWKLGLVFIFYSINLNLVQCQMSAGPIPCVCANCSDWILSTANYSTDDRLRPSLANGFFGTIVNNNDMHINGFYHGVLTSSNRIRVPNRLNLQVNFTGTNTYMLNMQMGIYEELIVNSDVGVNISIVSYASVGDKHYLITEITIKSANPVQSAISATVQSLPATDTSDMNVTNDADSTDQSIHIFQAVPNVAETNNVTIPNLSILTTNLPTNGQLTLNAGQTIQKYVFYSVITINNYSLAQELYTKGQDLAKSDANGTTGFMTGHMAVWNDTVSLPLSPTYDDDGWPFYGISPGSLANDDSHNYHGHVFWDQDLWMLIGVLPLHPDIVKRTLIDSRVRNIESAKNNAQRYGWAGARYPWELAYSGYETSPWDASGRYEIHVTGDSALCAQQYLELTNDTDFAQKYYNSSLEIARFYNSLLQPTHDTYLGIFNIMGPDEYHYPVNNSIYMNSIARNAIGLPGYIKKAFAVNGDDPDSNWNQNIGKIYMPFDESKQYHPQFDGYTYGTKIKQADVILLGYPLLVEMDPAIRENDLSIYQNVTDGGGPAMTWAMHSIGWLEYGQEDKASDMFKRNYNYMRAPFNIWTETSSGVGAVNFVTGMGGFMQNLIQGYIGVRIYANRLEFTPYLLPDTTSYSAVGLVYQEMLFNFDVDGTNVNVSLISSPKVGCVLIDENGKQTSLHTGLVFTGVIKKKRTITCQPSKLCSCPNSAWYQSSINPCNCYNFIQTPKDWASANSDCKMQDFRSSLASIDSAFENNDILASGKNQTSCSQLFIGLQEQTNNMWTWINNDTSTYRNWRTGYPDSDTNNKCGQINTSDGKWTNIDCSNTGCYVCEIKINL